MVDLVAPFAGRGGCERRLSAVDEGLDPFLEVRVFREVGDPERDLRPGRGDEVAEDVAGDVLLMAGSAASAASRWVRTIPPPRPADQR